MDFVGRSTDTQRVTVPMAYVLNGQEMGPGPDDAADAPPKTPLLIQKEGPGRLYYRVSLDVAPNDLTFEPVANGFVIERTFAAAVAEEYVGFVCFCLTSFDSIAVNLCLLLWRVCKPTTNLFFALPITFPPPPPFSLNLPRFVQPVWATWRRLATTLTG